jgi:hypothetical protein
MLVLVLVPVLVPDYARHHCVPSFIPKHECEQRRQKKKKKKKKKRKRKRERSPSSFSDSSDEGDYKVGGGALCLSALFNGRNCFVGVL